MGDRSGGIQVFLLNLCIRPFPLKSQEEIPLLLHGYLDSCRGNGICQEEGSHRIGENDSIGKDNDRKFLFFHVKL